MDVVIDLSCCRRACCRSPSGLCRRDAVIAIRRHRRWTLWSCGAANVQHLMKLLVVIIMVIISNICGCCCYRCSCCCFFAVCHLKFGAGAAFNDLLSRRSLRKYKHNNRYKQHSHRAAAREPQRTKNESRTKKKKKALLIFMRIMFASCSPATRWHLKWR